MVQLGIAEAIDVKCKRMATMNTVRFLEMRIGKSGSVRQSSIFLR